MIQENDAIQYYRPCPVLNNKLAVYNALALGLADLSQTNTFRELTTQRARPHHYQLLTLIEINLQLPSWAALTEFVRANRNDPLIIQERLAPVLQQFVKGLLDDAELCFQYFKDDFVLTTAQSLGLYQNHTSPFFQIEGIANELEPYILSLSENRFENNTVLGSHISKHMTELLHDWWISLGHALFTSANPTYLGDLVTKLFVDTTRIRVTTPLKEPFAVEPGDHTIARIVMKQCDDGSWMYYQHPAFGTVNLVALPVKPELAKRSSLDKMVQWTHQVVKPLAEGSSHINGFVLGLCDRFLAGKCENYLGLRPYQDLLRTIGGRDCLQKYRSNPTELQRYLSLILIEILRTSGLQWSDETNQLEDLGQLFHINIKITDETETRSLTEFYGTLHAECGLRPEQLEFMQTKKLLKPAQKEDYEWRETSAESLRDHLFEVFDAELIDFIILLHETTYQPAPTLVFANPKPGVWQYLQEKETAQLKLERASTLTNFHFQRSRPTATVILNLSSTEAPAPVEKADEDWSFM